MIYTVDAVPYLYLTYVYMCVVLLLSLSPSPCLKCFSKFLSPFPPLRNMPVSREGTSHPSLFVRVLKHYSKVGVFVSS